MIKKERVLSRHTFVTVFFDRSSSNFSRFIYKILFSVLFLYSLFFHGIGYAVEEKAQTGEAPKNNTSVVKTNALDNRKFDYLVLENELKVLLVSDTSLQKSAAAIDVYVGAGEDPEDIPGLAHFLEHMLFLGTKKYPDAGSFQSFISDHGGSNNAYTSIGHTNYYFDVDVSALDEALDRFSEFFITPQFNESLIDRERKAVHSEYTSKYVLDSRRTRDVLREIVHPDHPIANFTTGNHETLGNIEVEALRKSLIDFYKGHYSANIMTLVVAAPLPLDTMKSYVVDRFRLIPNRKLTPVKTHVPLFNENQLPLEVHVKPNKETHKLSMIFPVGNAEKDRHLKPLEYIGNFIGHEGEGSLLAVLKEKEWAINLNAGGYFAWRDGETFAVNIQLTPEGLQHVDVIQALVFDFIELLKKKGLQAWRYDELARLSQMSFNYAESGNTIREVSHLANSLQTLDAHELYTSAFHWEGFDQSVIAHYLDKLHAQNVLVLVTDPDVNGDHKTLYYQTPYSVKKREKSFALVEGKDSQRNVLRRQLALPPVNPYISKDFSIFVSSDAASEEELPEKIMDSSSLIAWYMNDNKSDLPKAAITARFKLPVVMQSVEHYVQLRVLLRMVKDSLNEESYAASLAGLSYSLSTNSRGFDIEFYGYNDALDVLVKRVVKRIQKAVRHKKTLKKLIDAHFVLAHQEMIRAQKNKSFDKLYSQVLGDVPPLLYTPFWSVDDITRALEKLSVNDVLENAPLLFENAQATVFVYGNYREKDARAIAKKINTVSRKRDKDSKIPPGQVLNLAGQPTLVHRTATDYDEAVIALYYQGLSDSFQDRAAMLVLEQCLSAPFYHSLRTEQQLGYVVSTMNYSMRKVPGMLLLVQSPVADVQDIHKAVLAFLRQASCQREEDASVAQKSVKLRLEEPPQNQWQWFHYYWSSISERDEGFETHSQLLNAVEGLNAENIVALNEQILIKGKPHILFYAANIRLDASLLGYPTTLVSDYLQEKKRLPKYSYH